MINDSLSHSSTDDTNPETETEEYVGAIREDVEWMGWTPHVTTHSSDYFEELHALAIRLIKNGLAYVCHQTKEEISACREVAKARQSNPNAPGELHRYENLAPPITTTSALPVLMAFQPFLFTMVMMIHTLSVLL